MLAYFSLTGHNLFQGLSQNSLLELSVEYFSLFLFILSGAWYGIWLGLGWYHTVYENPDCNICKRGFISHLVKEYWPQKTNPYLVRDKVRNLSEQIAEVGDNVEQASFRLGVKKPKAIRKKLVRKTKVKKSV